MTNRRCAPWPLSVVAAVTLALAGACGEPPSPTPNPTDVAAHDATVLASLPTAQSLTPRPTKTPVPMPTSTPVPLTVTPVPPTAAAMPATSPAATQAQAATPSVVDYTVQAGDTLLSIAMAYHVSMASIMLANDMGDSQVVKLGLVLHIPTAKTWPDESVFWFVYIVQPGEALSSIAAHFSVKLDDLVRVNQLTDASAIRVGQKLVITAAAFTPNEPVEPTSPPPPPEPTTRPKAADAAQESATQEAVAQVPATQEPAAQPTPAQQVQSKAQAAVAQVANVVGVEAMRGALLALYNQARVQAGLAPLAPSVILQSAAQRHADDCAQRGYGSHSGSDGSTVRERVTRAGYSGTIVSENWVWATSVAEAFDMWFNQEPDGGPHRGNILSPRFTEVGFGVAASAGGYYFIADFGTP